VAMAASANPILADKAVRVPTLFCTALKRQRFYMLMRSEPGYAPVSQPPTLFQLLSQAPGSTETVAGIPATARDIFNERLRREEQSIVAAAPAAASSRTVALASSATIYTTLGDLHLRLFPTANSQGCGLWRTSSVTHGARHHTMTGPSSTT